MLSETEQCRDKGVEGAIILKWSIRKWGTFMDWIELTHNRDRWQTRVINVINFGFRKIYGIFYCLYRLIHQQGVRCME